MINETQQPTKVQRQIKRSMKNKKKTTKLNLITTILVDNYLFAQAIYMLLYATCECCVLGYKVASLLQNCTKTIEIHSEHIAEVSV